MRSIALLPVLLAACASTSIMPIGEPVAARKKYCRVEVLASKPQRAHTDVCIISSTGGASILDDGRASSLVRDMKAAACECGADAIVVQSQTDVAVASVYGTAKSSAIGIRYTIDPSSAPIAPQAAK